MAEASGVTFRLAREARWLLPRVEDLASARVVPGGLGRNREFYGPRVDEGGVRDSLVDALYDPQTSGGLLISVAERALSGLRRALTRRRVPAIVVGRVVAKRRRPVE